MPPDQEQRHGGTDLVQRGLAEVAAGKMAKPIHIAAVRITVGAVGVILGLSGETPNIHHSVMLGRINGNVARLDVMDKFKESARMDRHRTFLGVG